MYTAKSGECFSSFTVYMLSHTVIGNFEKLVALSNRMAFHTIKKKNTDRNEAIYFSNCDGSVKKKKEKFFYVCWPLLNILSLYPITQSMKHAVLFIHWFVTKLTYPNIGSCFGKSRGESHDRKSMEIPAQNPKQKWIIFIYLKKVLRHQRKGRRVPRRHCRNQCIQIH